MCKYIPQTFMIPVSDELKEFFKQMSFVEVHPQLVTTESKPLVPMGPTALKFYQRWSERQKKGKV